MPIQTKSSAEALQLLSKRDRYQQWAIEFDPPKSPLKKGTFLKRRRN